MDLKKIYPRKVKTKNGREIVLKMPDKTHLREMQGFINELVDEDVPILKNEKIRLEDERKYLKDLLKRIEEKKSVHIYAFHRSKLIANTGVSVGKFRKRHVGDFGISVAKDFRSDGIGSLMTEEVLMLAKDYLKLKIITLEVFAGNVSAINLYEKVGFKEYGRLPNALFYEDKYSDAIFMYKDL